VLHVGNVANNGYINAKLQRRVGVEADAVCDEWHMISQPEWEDAPLEPVEDPLAPLKPDDWDRPDWVLSPRTWDPRGEGERWLVERLRLAVDGPALVARYPGFRRQYEPLRRILGHDLRLADLLRAGAWLNRFDRQFGRARQLFARYDVVQAYGIHPILLLLAGGGRPFVSFEHGTLRELPFEDDWYGRLLSLAYRSAAKLIITNPDVLASAQRLGLENYVFIPHPVDEEKYRPGASELRAQLDAEGWDFVVVAPSRHDWDIKGTDRMLRGFAEVVRNRPRALLVLFEWGLELDRSRALIAELGIEANVRWSLPLPKLRLIDAYRGADLVLDQFELGTFGAIAPEAMACGSPVLLAFEPEIHRWCFEELPPVVAARSAEQIGAALTRLAQDEGERERLGRAGRDWVERYHGWRLVVDRQQALYEELMGAGYSQGAR
jgi:glycosyltransferase involved in cell wall biosynthesis